jgi:tetratricopeptide (TPR) repeat protein
MRFSSLLCAFVFWLAACLGLTAQQVDPASRVYELASKSVFLIVIRSSAGEPIARGTGFLIAENKLVTNQHVVREGNPFLDLGAVKLSLRVEQVDPVNDLAILTVNGELSAPSLQMATSEPKPGTAIYAIGNPAGLERSISSGVVAGIRNMSGRELIQISAPISPGSSGGPILNSQSQVVAVAVGILEGGQNINFAVPVKFVQMLLSGTTAPADVPMLLSLVDEISANRNQNQKYSDDPDSPWMKSKKEMESAFRQALSLAGKDVPSLKLIADKALGAFFTIEPTIAVNASERLVQIKPNSDNYALLAKSLQSAAFWDQPQGDKNSPNLKNAEQAIRSAFAATKQPTMEMQALKGSILEDRGLVVESKAAFLKAYEMAKTRNDSDELGTAIRGLIRTASATPSIPETDGWFKVLVDAGLVNWYDWDGQARRLYARGDFRASGDDFALAASPSNWDDYCAAASAYVLDGKAPDLVLETARACIANGAGKDGSDPKLALAHSNIASVLNSRAVYEEALSHNREAVAIAPDNAFYQDTLADSLLGLRRFQEAINASKQAIRLSDGKYASMHFTLGSGYFGVEDWESARQSYEKASELDQTNAAAAYNVAVCLARLSLFHDAASWYEEVLKRDPNYPQKDDIRSRIQSLRK